MADVIDKKRFDSLVEKPKKKEFRMKDKFIKQGFKNIDELLESCKIFRCTGQNISFDRFARELFPNFNFNLI